MSSPFAWLGCSLQSGARQNRPGARRHLPTPIVATGANTTSDVNGVVGLQRVFVAGWFFWNRKARRTHHSLGIPSRWISALKANVGSFRSASVFAKVATVRAALP